MGTNWQHGQVTPQVQIANDRFVDAQILAFEPLDADWQQVGERFAVVTTGAKALIAADHDEPAPALDGGRELALGVVGNRRGVDAFQQ